MLIGLRIGFKLKTGLTKVMFGWVRGITFHFSVFTDFSLLSLFTFHFYHFITWRGIPPRQLKRSLDVMKKKINPIQNNVLWYSCLRLRRTALKYKTKNKLETVMAVWLFQSLRKTSMNYTQLAWFINLFDG